MEHLESSIYVGAMVLALTVSLWGAFHKPKRKVEEQPGEYRQIRDREAWVRNVETRWQ